MAESKTLISCPLLRLPVELWQHIATFMTLREWAQVSGACKLMWRLPLLELKITPGTTRHTHNAAGDLTSILLSITCRLFWEALEGCT